MANQADLTLPPGTLLADLAIKDDAGDIIEMSKMAHGLSDIVASHANYAWRHCQNPAGLATVPILRDSSGKVVGSISVVPQKLHVHGQTVLGAAVSNLLIHPDHRNTFGFAKLMRRFDRVMEEQSIPAHLSFVSKNTYDRERTHSPESVTQVPLLFRALDLTSLARDSLDGGWQRFLARRFGHLASPFLFHRRDLAQIDELNITDGDLDSAEFDRFWSRVRDKYPVQTVRDRAYLSWRFSIPSGPDYHTLMARLEERMLGYAVLSCATVRGIKTGLVMDLLVTDDPSGQASGLQLLAAAEVYFRSRGMSASAALMMPFCQEYRLLRRSGYWHVPGRFSPLSFCFQVVVHDAQAADWGELTAGDWFITLADYESR